MGFKITKDNVHDKETENKWYAVGKEFGNYKGGQHKFRLSDDDNEIYFYGLSDCDSSFKPLDHYGASFGCVHIEYRNEETKKYEYL